MFRNCSILLAQNEVKEMGLYKGGWRLEPFFKIGPSKDSFQVYERRLVLLRCTVDVK